MPTVTSLAYWLERHTGIRVPITQSHSETRQYIREARLAYRLDHRTTPEGLWHESA
jgi:hypothetical protein